MVDHNDTKLELGGQVQGEARSRQTWSRGGDPLQQVLHDIITCLRNIDLKEFSAGNFDALCSNQPELQVIRCHCTQVTPVLVSLLLRLSFVQLVVFFGSIFCEFV